MNTHRNKRLLEGQRVLVTGAKVMMSYLDDRKNAERMAERIRAKQEQSMIFQTDVNKESQVKSMFDVLMGYWSSVNILVNNTSLQKDAALVEMSLKRWSKVISVNLTGQFLCVREAGLWKVLHAF